MIEHRLFGVCLVREASEGKLATDELGCPEPSFASA
jgi:hypothetical protein